jgi:radical SAM protein with 4Fe4S-binding SPASM domain
MKAMTEPPLHVAWEITRRCNAHCVHCSSSAGPEVQALQEYSTADALQLIDQLAEAGVRVLAFSGGEPLLRADLPALIRYAAQRGLTTNVCTNGSLLDDAMALRLKEAGLNSVTVSLDGACAETHDNLRQYPGLFDLAVNAIRTLVKQGHRVGISFTPTISNYQQAAQVVQLAHSLGTDSVCLSQYIPTGRGTRNLMLAPAQLGDLAHDVLELRARYARRMQVHCHDCHVALLLPPEEQKDYKGCGAGTATAGICADGTVTPCVFMPNGVGNLRSASFREIWENSPLLHSMRDRDQLQAGNCGACRFKLICGGCRAAAMAIHGDPMHGDPSCWMFPETATPAGQTSGAA